MPEWKGEDLTGRAEGREVGLSAVRQRNAFFGITTLTLTVRPNSRPHKNPPALPPSLFKFCGFAFLVRRRLFFGFSLFVGNFAPLFPGDAGFFAGKFVSGACAMRGAPTFSRDFA